MNKREVKVIYYLGMFTGQRMKDCVLLRWSKINLEINRIWFKQFKTGKEVTIPIAPPLREVLVSALTWKTSDVDYVCPNVAARYNKTNASGKNVGNNLVNIDMLRVIRWIGLEPSVSVPGRDKKVTVYGFHSLRHSFASYCAEAGVPQATVVSILGADSEVVTKYYPMWAMRLKDRLLQLFPVSICQIQPKIRLMKLYLSSTLPMLQAMKFWLK
jgi:integrase